MVWASKGFIILRLTKLGDLLREELIDVALRKKPADIVIKDGNLVNVYTGEIYRSDVAIKSGRIASVGRSDGLVSNNTTVVNAKGKYLVPGLIDGHVHIESSMMEVTQFARAVLPIGTTGVITDWHEVGVVAGLRGIKTMLDIGSRTPLKIYWVVPSHGPVLKGLETVGFLIGPKEINGALKWREAIGLSEALAAGVASHSKPLLNSIRSTIELGKTVEGHAAGFGGDELQSWVAAGVESDHEPTTTEEALERVRLGIGLMMREGSVSKDLTECVKVLTQRRIDPQNCMMVTDDAHPTDLVKSGHMNFKVRRAIEEGVDPVTAIQMASLNTARHFRIDRDVGGIAPGKCADILIVDNLREFNIEKVFANGKLVAENGKFILRMDRPKYPAALRRTIHLKKRITPKDLMVNAGGKERVDVKVLLVHDDTLLKDVNRVTLSVKKGVVQPDVSKDVLALAVVERHKVTGNIGKGFVSGFGLRSGAIASTVAHDNHNIIIVGTNFEDMAVAANRLAQSQGGLIAVSDGRTLELVELPICGLLSDLPVAEVSKKLESLHGAVRKLGGKLRSPFMTMSFIPCAIPQLLMSDRGLVDPIRLKLVDLMEG